MKKYLLLCLLLWPTGFIFCMQTTSVAMVLHNPDLCNLISQHICIANEYQLQGIHNDLSSLRRTNTESSSHFFTEGYDLKIVDFLSQGPYYFSTKDIACTFKFSPKAIESFSTFFKTITDMHHEATFSAKDLAQCSEIYYPELVRRTLFFKKWAATEQLLQLPSLKLRKCNPSYCINAVISTAILTCSSCPLVSGVANLLIHYYSKQKDKPDLTKLFSVIKLLLDKHKMNPNHLMDQHKTILWNAIYHDYVELAKLLMEHGADPYAEEHKAIVYDGNNVNIFQAYANKEWAKQMYAEIQQNNLKKT